MSSSEVAARRAAPKKVTRRGIRHLLCHEYPTNVRDRVRGLREAISASRDDTVRQAMLDLHHGHVTDAAAALGVTRYALARAIEKHGLGEAH
ncbi:MAG TPA: hypothetical protein VLM85_15745 [Polyangiaceae bacterium]|nr:hypothetical protein [Polyangiaceae bacterium]